MVEHQFLMSLLILFINIFIVLLYTYNVIVRIHKCINSDNRRELNYHFKLVMISLISILISSGMFYLSLKLMYRLLDLPSNFLLVERLFITLGMAARAILIITVDKLYNPFYRECPKS